MLLLSHCDWSAFQNREYYLCIMWNNVVESAESREVCGLVSTLVESELFMYGSAQWLIPP